MGLSVKQKLWITEYLACGFNGVEAARRADYKHPESAARDNLRNTLIRSKIQEIMGERTLAADECLMLLSSIASGTQEGVRVREQLRALEILMKFYDPEPDKPGFVKLSPESITLMERLELTQQQLSAGIERLLIKVTEERGNNNGAHDPSERFSAS